MQKELRAKLKKQLQTEQARLEQELTSVEKDSLGVSEVEQSGELPDVFHMADTGSVTFERERDLSLGRNIRDILARVELALRRIETGSYGSCSHCGREIPRERLEALPYADLCMPCKVREERQR